MKQAICKAAAIVLATSAALTPFSARAQTGATHGVIGVSKTGHSVYDSASRVLVKEQDGRWRIAK